MNTDLFRAQQRRIIADLVDGVAVRLLDVTVRWAMRGETLATKSPPALAPRQAVRDSGVYVLVDGSGPLTGTRAMPWQFICHLDDIVEALGIYFDSDAEWESWVLGYRVTLAPLRIDTVHAEALSA